MKVSTKGRYALRVMLDIAAQGAGRTVPLKEIAARQELTIKYLEQIVPALCRAGLLTGTRGAGGGYRLAVEPARCRVGDVLRAVEGELVPVACLEGAENLCPRRDACPSLGFWEGLRAAIDAYVDGVTLADLASAPEGGAEPG